MSARADRGCRGGARHRSASSPPTRRSTSYSATTSTSRPSSPTCASYQSIALVFPKWVDGRAYSQARLLRSRYRFAGEIRATGEVLVDMMPLLARTGFDAAAMRADQSQEVAERALSFFPDGHYQGDVIEHAAALRAARGGASA